MLASKDEFSHLNVSKVGDPSRYAFTSRVRGLIYKQRLKDLGELEPSDDEREYLCRAFTLLDVDGDGVIQIPDLKKLLMAWGRLPFNDDLADIMFYAESEGCEGTIGMVYSDFEKYILEQLVNTSDEDALREAFQIFDTSPPTGRLNLVELRHYLKHKEIKLTDDEIDFLYREEDYWMLEEKNMFEYEQLIAKLLDKPTCTSRFLGC